MVHKKIRKEKFGKRLKEKLAASRSRMAEVNVGKIAKLTKKGDVVAVPGKVLGMGSISHAVTVAAKSFSSSARKKIEAAGGKAMAIGDLDAKARMIA